MATTHVIFKTMDGETVIVEKEIASNSEWVKHIVDGSEQNDEIPLPQIKKAILDKVIEYCTYINTNPPPVIEQPLISNDLSELVSPWYAEFVNLEQEVLFDLIHAANFLDIKSLLKLASAKVATLIKGMTIPEIREFFNTDDDFLPEEQPHI